MTKKGMRQKKGEDKHLQRKPSSYDIMDRILGISHVMMCRGCKYKPLCRSAVICQDEGKIEAKISLISERDGVESIKSVTPGEMLLKIDGVSDDDLIEFMDRVVKNDEQTDESLNEKEDKTNDSKENIETDKKGEESEDTKF